MLFWRKGKDAGVKKRKMIEEFERLVGGPDAEKPRYSDGDFPMHAWYGRNILSMVEGSADSLSLHVRGRGMLPQDPSQ